MLRSLFLSVGVFVALVGAGLLKVDTIVLTGEGELVSDYHGLIRVDDGDRHVIDPPDWAPFSLMAIGGVTILYSIALPSRRREGG